MTRRGLLLFVAMCLIWGIPYLFIRIAVSELAPVTLVFLRTAVAAVVLMPIAIRQGGFRHLFDKSLPLVMFALIEIGIPWLAISTAEQHISSSLAGLLISAVPLVGVMMAPLFGNRDRIGPRHLSSLPAVSVNAATLTLCAILYGPLAAFQWPRTIPSYGVLASVAVLALVCSALAFLIFFALVAEIGPVPATVITYINPAVAAVAGILVLHENFRAGMGIGFILVLAGSALATRLARQRRPGLLEEAVTLRDR